MRRRTLNAAISTSLATLGASPAVAIAQGRGSALVPGRKVLRVALPTPETVLDPVQTNSDHYTVVLLSQIFEAPLTYDYLARPVRLVPCTAATMPEVSADGRVFAVRIKPGIYFADDPAFKGQKRELLAADYVYGLKRFYDPAYNSSDLYVFESLKLPGLSELRGQAVKNKQPFDYDTPVEGIRALDRYTFQITLGVADPRFIYTLATPIYMHPVAREVVQHYGSEIGAHPVGTGAFKLKGWQRAARVVLERSPNYRGEIYSGQPADDPVAQAAAKHLAGKTLPLVDEIVASVVEEAQPRWLSFLNGGFDWLLVPPNFRAMAAPGRQLAPYLAKRGVAMHLHVQPDMNMHFFFMEHPVVGGYTPEKVALRRAIALAFDSQALTRHVYSGFGVPAQSTIAPFTSGYDPSYKSEMSDYSPARAKALLDLFGYTDRDGDGWREQPGGQALTLVLAGSASQQERRVHEVWKRCMTAVGIKIEFDISSWPELLKKSRAGSLMMWGYSWSAGSPDGGFFLGIAYGPNASESNDPRFSLPAFDRLFEKQRELPDGPERNAVITQAKNLLTAYMPFKVHQHSVFVDLVQPWTRSYWRHPFMRDTWRFADVLPALQAADNAST